MANSTDQSRVGYVTIAIVGSRGEARRIVDRLESIGIDCFVADERAVQASTTGPRAGGGTKIQVGRSDVNQAVQALHQTFDREKTKPSSKYKPTRLIDRHWMDLNSWRGATIGTAVLLVFAVLLALWLF